MTVGQQIAANKDHIVPKYKANKLSPTFKTSAILMLPPADMEGYLKQACLENVVGLALATRPDCVSDEHLEVLAKIRREYKVDIFVELGLQTVNYHSLIKVNRGHTLAEFIRRGAKNEEIRY